MSHLTNTQKINIRKDIYKGIEDRTLSLAKLCKKYGVYNQLIRYFMKKDKKLEEAYQNYKGGPKQKSRERYYNKENPSHERYYNRENPSQECSNKQNSKPYKGKEVEKSFSEKTGTVTTRSLDIKTVEELLKVAEVDMNIWEVDRHLINSWEVTIGSIKTGTGQCETFTNYQVKVWLKRKEPSISALEDLYEKIKVVSPIVPIIQRPKIKIAKSGGDARELEISLMDIHLGMRTFKPASEQNWNVDIAEKMTMEILEMLLESAKKYGPFERIIFPMGNDFLHTDNCYNTTTAGTFQPEADAWKQSFLRGELLGLAIMERLIKEAPVKVIAIQGNHAQHSEIALSRIFKAYYHNNKNFLVDASMAPFTFHHYGVNLLGFEHGHSIRQQIRLAALMANETRLNGWKEARYCEWHCGDQHRKGSGKPMHFEELGVSIEFLPGLVPPNEWHKLHAFSWQKRAGMAFVWDKTAGPIARLQVNVDNYTNKIMK